MRALLILLLLTATAQADSDILFQIGPTTAKQSLTDDDTKRVIDHAVKAYQLSPDESVQRMLNDIITGILVNVEAGDKATAAKAASDAVVPIVPVDAADAVKK